MKKLTRPLLLLLCTALACTLPGAPGSTPAPPPPPTFSASAATHTSPPDSAPAAADTLSPQEAADVIFFNGTVLTMQPGVITTAIAIKGDRIMTLGNDANLLRFAGPDTAIIDLAGRTLMPGFVDPHSHLFDRAGGDYGAAQDLALSNGITTVADLFVLSDLLQDLVDLDSTGGLRMRVSAYPVHVDNCGQVLGAWYAEAYPVSREPGAMLQIPGVKMFNDGGSCNAPAVSYEYPGGAGHGDLYFSAEDLAAMIVEVQSSGYQAAIHSAGDRAIETALDALEIALDGGPNVYRHRIEHNTVLREDLFPRYSEVDPVALIFGAFPACLWAGDVSNFKYITPEEFRDWEWPWRPLLDNNPEVHFAWHSDYPVFGALSPFADLYGFVTRRQIAADGSICDPPSWAADDVLSVEEALPLMTIDAAFALFREDEIGSLAIGKLADLIVIPANPYEVDPNDLQGIRVLMTMVGGQTVYCAEGAGSLCP